MTVVNQSNVINAGVQVVQTSAPSEIVAVSPLAPNQVLGNDGAGNIAPVELVAGANVTITQTGTQLSLASTGGGNSTVGAVDGVYSPVQLDIATLSADVPITVAFTSETPPLSAMQTIATVTIVSKYGGNGVQGSIQAYCVPSFECPYNQALGVQFCLYVSSVGDTTPVSSSINGVGSFATNLTIYSNSASSLVEASVPSSVGQTFTFTLAASYIQSSSASIIASEFTFYAVENAADTYGVVDSNVIDLGTTPITITGTNVNSGATPLIGFDQSIVKTYSNSSLRISFSAQLEGINTSSTFNAYIYFYLGTSIQLASLVAGYVASSYNTTSIGSGRVNPTAPLYASAPVSLLIPPGASISGGSLQAGLVRVYIGGTYGLAQSKFLPALSSLVIEEVLPISSGGIVQAYNLFSSTYIQYTPPYSANKSPQYSATTPVFGATVFTRTVGGYLRFSGYIQLFGLGGTTGAVGASQVLLCFYSSNDPSALPFAVRAYSMDATSYYFSYPYTVVVPTTQQDVAFPIYVTLASLKSPAVKVDMALQLDFEEIFIGNSLVSGTIDTITTDSGSFLSATKAGTTVTLDTVQSTPTQVGLVSTSNIVPANSLLQMESSGAVGCTISSTDNSVVITPSSGTIDLSSPLNISTGTGAFGVVRSNNLNVASISPNVAWNADYIIGGASSGSQKTIFDSTASFVSAYTGSSSQLNLSEYTRFTATAASPPVANNTASPQWVAVLQPLSVTLLQPKVIELIITPALLGALSTQAQAFSKDAYYRYVLGVNMTATGTPIEFSRMTLLPLESDLYGQTTAPTVANTPPWFTFDVVPAAGNPSSQFTTGNVLVIYAQWILSTVTGITPQFNLAFRTLF